MGGWGEKHEVEPTECSICHALTKNREAHLTWHEQQARELTGAALRMHRGELHRVDL